MKKRIDPSCQLNNDLNSYVIIIKCLVRIIRAAPNMAISTLCITFDIHASQRKNPYDFGESSQL